MGRVEPAHSNPVFYNGPRGRPLVEVSVSGFPIWAHHQVVTPDRCLQSITARPGPNLLATGEPSIDLKSRVRDPVPPAYIWHLRARFMLPQNPDDLFLAESTALHSSVSLA
jgi:hypothetical protein